MIERAELLVAAIAKRGMWIGLFPDDRPEAGFVNGPTISNPHITIAHLGRTHDEPKVDRAIASLAAAAFQLDAFTADVHGVARFRGSKRDGDPLVLLLKADAFRSAHAAVTASLRTNGVDFDERFAFTPHVTITRIGVDNAAMYPPVSDVRPAKFSFSTIALVCGDGRAIYNLRAPSF